MNILLFICRRHKESMMRLRDLLSESCKAKRHRRNLFNIHVTILGWLVESSGTFIILLGSFFLGNTSHSITLLLQTLSLIIQYNILPLVFLINDPDLKVNMADSRFYIMVLKFLNWQHNSQIEEHEREENRQT